MSRKQSVAEMRQELKKILGGSSYSDVKWPTSQVIDGLELRCTCPGMPEQYDVYDGNTQVAYFRLRDGEFTVEIPNCGGRLVHEAFPRGDGWFEGDERQEHLTAAVRAVRKAQGVE